MVKPYRVNVSSVQDFMQCRFRWWCKWVQNRVPIATSPALDTGKLIHRIFEHAEKADVDLAIAAKMECDAFEALIPNAHPAAQPGARKSVLAIRDLDGAWPLWRDKFVIDEVLEIEQPYEWMDPEYPILWLLRPDRVVISGGKLWHQQRRGLAGSSNFGRYVRLAKRHYHEHLYGRAMSCKYQERGLPWGGTVFDLVRKLKFRTNVGKKNEATKTYDDMFWQHPVAYDLNSRLHKSVFASMHQHVHEMQTVEKRWRKYGEIPAPNEKLNGGINGNSEDPFFRVLIGEITLDDNDEFKAREDTYATPEEVEG